MKAAVMRSTGAPLVIEDIELADPAPHEVVVRIAAVGVCHSDLHIMDGTLPVRAPMVLGHEPAGIVEAVGSEVHAFAAGDHVIGCLSVFCGQCDYCASGRTYLCGGEATMRRSDEAPRLSKQGEPIYQMTHLGAFAEYMLVHENALVKIREDMPLDRAALIGCGVTTGLGAALNTARIRPGQTAAVIGCGGVGLSIIQGCRIAGAKRIVAVDTEEWKLELAKTLGATDGILAGGAGGDARKGVLEITHGGVDFAFEAIGTAATAKQAVGMVCPGGTAVFVGIAPVGTNVELHLAELVFRGKSILGCQMGSNQFRIDMPNYVELYLNGTLKLDEMISARLPLERINEAFDSMRKGTAARSVIVFD
jgi:S-(hydroxymethyl)glutathione dehydrogenase/alcohol dehydrogenase